jgi:hypothetical protein
MDGWMDRLNGWMDGWIIPPTDLFRHLNPEGVDIYRNIYDFHRFVAARCSEGYSKNGPP